MKSLKKEYRDLEMKVLRKLREMVENSKCESCQISGNAVYLYDYREKNIDFEYCEICIINDRTVFIDEFGHSTDTVNIDLQTLINIIEYFTK